MNTARFLSRMWYYFRIGYATYLTFLLGYTSTLVTVYYLAIKNIPDLLRIFPNFGPFTILATAIGAPLSIGVGWFHLKRSTLFSSESDISVESNPWCYKPTPGFQKDFMVPMMIAQIRILRRMAEGTLTSSDLHDIEDLEAKYRTILAGGFIGTPKRRTNF